MPEAVLRMSDVENPTFELDDLISEHGLCECPLDGILTEELPLPVSNSIKYGLSSAPYLRVLSLSAARKSVCGEIIRPPISATPIA